MLMAIPWYTLLPRGGSWGGYSVVEAGRLLHTGEELYLVMRASRRLVSDIELEWMQPVTAINQIPDCRAFDLFYVRDASER